MTANAARLREAIPHPPDGRSPSRRGRRRPARRLVVLALAACLAAACDHGGSIVVENNMSVDLIARISGTETVRSPSPGRGPRAAVYRVVVVPAHSKAVIANRGFADPWDFDELDLLESNCHVMLVLHVGGGHRFVIGERWQVQQSGDFPQDAMPAAAADYCLGDGSALP